VISILRPKPIAVHFIYSLSITIFVPAGIMNIKGGLVWLSCHHTIQLKQFEVSQHLKRTGKQDEHQNFI